MKLPDTKQVAYIALGLGALALTISLMNRKMLKAMYSSPASSFNGSDDTLNCCGK